MSLEELDEVTEDVRTRYPEVNFPDYRMENIFRGMNRADSELIKGRKAIVLTQERIDPKTKRLFADDYTAAICSDQYMLIPHEWAIWRFEKILTESEAFTPFGRAMINPSLMGNGGAKMRLTATFPESEIKIGDDLINPKAGIKNSLDLSLEWEPWFGGRVKRCTNGLLMWGNLISGGRKHKLSLNLEQNINRLISGVDKMDEMFAIWDQWSKKKLSQADAFEMLEASPLSEKQVENIKKLPEIGTNIRLDQQKEVTQWFVNSVVTQYIEHEMDNTPSRMQTEEKITNYLNKQFNKK